MPTYISLMKFTEQGIRNVKDHPKRRENAAKGIESMGGKLLHTYLTMGRYDLVCVIEGPDDETVARALLTLGSQGNVQTETLPAFTEDQFRKITGAI